MVWKKHFFICKFISLRRVVIIVRNISLRELRNNKRHFASYFFYLFIFFFVLVATRAIDIYLLSQQVIAANHLQQRKKRPRKKPALNSPAKRRLKNCWKPATVLKMSFIIGIFQGLWLQRSERLFLRICFSGCFRIFAIQKQSSGGVL